jgi:phenylacetate-CoA ligase
MTRVKGRTDDMIIVKGARFFPSEIEAVLFEVEGTEPHYQIQLDREAGVEKVTVLVEVSEATFFDQMKKQAVVKETIVRRLAAEVGVTVDVKLVGKKVLERFDGKAKRVIDRRKVE